MQVIIPPGPSGNVIVTIAIGQAYLQAWENNAFYSWADYCNRYQLGLIVFDNDLIVSYDNHWKKPTWQKMLIGYTLKKAGVAVNNICYLDTDILISPLAPNIFTDYVPDKIGLVSLRNHLPYPYQKVLRRVAFLRHKFYDSTYPLDSALFMSLEQLYMYHDLPVQQDEACMGLIMFNMREHSEIMKTWFYKYDNNIQSITGGGDQTHVNYEIQNWGKVQWLGYEFQAIWLFEMAWKYPFLYEVDRNNKGIIRKCIESSLYTNHFLHFAGSWYESEMWKIGGFFQNKKKKYLINDYYAYLDTLVTGEPKGIIKPSKEHNIANSKDILQNYH